MASIHSEVLIEAHPAYLWAALRDVGNVHHLFRGVATDARLEGDIRIVTFANGLVVRERVVAVDEKRRRVVYASVRDGLVHHSASMQVFAEGEGGSRFVWISDFLPDSLEVSIRPLVELGMAAIKRTMEDQAQPGDPTKDQEVCREAGLPAAPSVMSTESRRTSMMLSTDPRR